MPKAAPEIAIAHHSVAYVTHIMWKERGFEIQKLEVLPPIIDNYIDFILNKRGFSHFYLAKCQ